MLGYFPCIANVWKCSGNPIECTQHFWGCLKIAVLLSIYLYSFFLAFSELSNIYLTKYYNNEAITTEKINGRILLTSQQTIARCKSHNSSD